MRARTMYFWLFGSWKIWGPTGRKYLFWGVEILVHEATPHAPLAFPSVLININNRVILLNLLNSYQNKIIPWDTSSIV